MLTYDDLVMPFPTGSHTQLLPLPYLPLKVVRQPRVEQLFSQHIHQFNAIQSQVLWSLLNTKWHSLLCAPTAAGKSTMAYILALYVGFIQSGLPKLTIIQDCCNREAGCLDPHRCAQEKHRR